MSRQPLRTLLLVAACAPLAACSSAVRKPALFGPGTAPMQRANAEVFDPYPDPEMGPDVVGSRPREYDKPRDEVRQSQHFLRSHGARPVQEVASAPIPVGPPVPISQALPVTQPFPTTPVYPSGPRY